MSHSPRDAFTISLNSNYLESTRTLDRLGRAGFSWSGNEKNVALLNTGTAGGTVRFADVSALSGFNFPDDGRAAGLTDWDGDGDIDVWVMNRTAPQIRFLENTTRSAKTGGPAFLMLRLEGDGEACSREATGAQAEVILPGKAPRLIRTVHTGDTHCSQSTRWLHFGLGDWTGKPIVPKLSVRWPDGKVEEFSRLEINRHYTLKRGGRPVVWRAQVSEVPSKATPPAPVTSPPVGLTVYSNRLPPPPIEWKDFGGESHALADLNGRPVALLLWASWCGNCRAELKAIGPIVERLKAAEVTLVALSIDGATVESGGDREKARVLWRSTGVGDGQAGEADAALMGRLESFHGALHWIGGPLRIPGLFLFDRDGRLVAHGEGVLEDDAWKKALDALAAPPGEWMARALPFPGRQYGPLAPIRMADVPQHLMEDDAFDLAGEYLAAHGPAIEAACRDKREPGYPRVLYTLAVHQAGLGRKDEAVDLYRKAVDLKPAYVDARYNLAGLLWELGRNDEAINHYTTLVTNVPSHAASWHNRGMMRQQAGDVDGAIGDFQQALVHAPGSIDSMNNLANSLLSAKRDDEAIALLERALAAAPGDARTHYNYALALEQAVRWNDAAAAYRRAIELDPQNAQYPHNLGVLFAKQSRWDEAETFLRRAIELQPDHPTARRNLQRVLDLRSGP